MKLDAHRIVGKMLMWIENWLSNKKQRVILNGCLSEWTDVMNEVPQRSVLGPLLFVIFINDIDNCVAGKILKFADDTKIFQTVVSAEDVSALQSDLSNLVAWFKEWQMLFNVEKCKVMHIGYNNVQVEYVVNDVKLERVADEKDLG